MKEEGEKERGREGGRVRERVRVKIRESEAGKVIQSDSARTQYIEPSISNGAHSRVTFFERNTA
jgi:hypothetical protein